MEIPSKLSEQIAFNTRSKIEEHMLIDMDESTPEEHFSQPLQINNKQFEIEVTFLTGYSGIYNVTAKTNKFYFIKSVTNKDGFIQIQIPNGAYELQNLNHEFKRITIEEGHYTEANYPI